MGVKSHPTKLKKNYMGLAEDAYVSEAEGLSTIDTGSFAHIF
jgi:hypothetical protein